MTPEERIVTLGLELPKALPPRGNYIACRQVGDLLYLAGHGPRLQDNTYRLGKIESQEHAVAALVTSDDPWLRSCGAYAIGSFGLVSLECELNRCLNDADPLLRETARAAKARLEQGARRAKV